jgi:hypothetical protein
MRTANAASLIFVMDRLARTRSVALFGTGVDRALLMWQETGSGKK